MTFLERVYQRAALCRAFEEECYQRIQSGQIKCPTYLSAGQEYIPATIATWLEDHPEIGKPKIFIQHRGHSHYLCFGGDMLKLCLELLGSPRGCAGGRGGSASIHSPEAGIVGHDGLMGSQVPIGVGYAFASMMPTIIFAGDAAMEEDYALASLGWAATHKLPVLFVVEDNNLSILTEKKVRRSWGLSSVAKGFGVDSWGITDHRIEIKTVLNNMALPALVNVSTSRLFWHAGAGQDGQPFDRHQQVSEELPLDFVSRERGQAAEKVKAAWKEAENAA